MKEQSLVRALSFASLGLGAAELLMPRQVARYVGLNRNHDSLIRLLGLREIVSGLGLMQGKPAFFLWSRVAGDAMDLALLGTAMRSPENDRRRLNNALVAVAAVTALDVAASVLASREHSEPGWRVNESDTYAAGFERGDPAALRACCDAAMNEPALTNFARGRDDLAGPDDNIEQTASPAEHRS